MWCQCLSLASNNINWSLYTLLFAMFPENAVYNLPCILKVQCGPRCECDGREAYMQVLQYCFQHDCSPSLVIPASLSKHFVKACLASCISELKWHIYSAFRRLWNCKCRICSSHYSGMFVGWSVMSYVCFRKQITIAGSDDPVIAEHSR